MPNPDRASLTTEAGTYVLWLRLGKGRRIRVGGLGTFPFAAGYYAYVGSAFGPGGLAARLGRHFRPNKSLRWHVDYLTRVSEPCAAWVCYDDTRHEHRWAATLAGLRGAHLPVRRFGSSDCGCASHLVWFPRRPSLRVFRALCGTGVGRTDVIKRFCE